ncbi:hypothetical protein DL89DRAFT_265856 [Linderina pennispora]|uniref:Timeless N-terminal domain-containing protein n=1 Tax=Linderina pennispora TaxID=61395 RepID=A0A1Y1WFB4_9FUNG|nr:uncharacterized protein DL89DRAFT_265856 [Linderina pennispora]ORX72251.1 hypothetical protein DL89DRAFT_265856 [Linderina pennispora]
MLEQDVIDDVAMDEEHEEGEDGPAFTEEELSEELQRYRNVVLSACSSLGNLQPVAPKAAANKDDPATQATEKPLEGGQEPKEKAGQEQIKMEYVPSSDCLASLKDIKRYIQMDERGDGKLVLQWLGEWGILKSDIIPIFTLSVKKLMSDSANQAGQERLSEPDRDYLLKTIMMCVELFVFLTWSMESEPEEVYTRFIRILRSYKAMFADSKVISSMMAVVVMYLRKNHYTSRESMLIKGILYVFRNILAIPDPLISPTSKGLTKIEVQDRLIAVLEKEMAVDFFLTLMSSADQPRFKELRATLLDIIYYLFYRVPPSALFDRPQTWFKGTNPNARIGRHNNFGGVYAVSTGDGIVMPVFSAKEALQPFANLFRKAAHVQKPKATEHTTVDKQWRPIDLECVATLRRIAAMFIESCFNPFVSALFEDVKANMTAMKEQMPRLLYISAYFVDISLANDNIDLGSICALVQSHIFGLIMRCTNDFLDLRQWAALDPAMYCIQQILTSLTKMRGSKLDALSDNVLGNLFYDGDALDLFVKMCRVFKPTKNTREFLLQVAQTVEAFLSTLRAYAESKSSMFVRKRVKKRKHSTKVQADEDDGNASDELETNAPPPAEPAEPTTRESEAGNGDEEQDVDNSDGDDNRPEYAEVERVFDMGKYERAFATAEVVKAYSFLLTPPLGTEYVLPMFFRIAVTHKRPQLFFKRAVMLRLLVLFDDKYTYPRRGELIDLAAWIFRQYSMVLSSPALTHQFKAEDINNKLAMECMLAFLKTSKAGTAVEPVITRHLITLHASNESDQEQDGAEASAGEDTRPSSSNEEAPMANQAKATTSECTSQAAISNSNSNSNSNRNIMDEYPSDEELGWSRDAYPIGSTVNQDPQIDEDEDQLGAEMFMDF